VVRFVRTTGRNQSRRGRALEILHERMKWAARRPFADLPQRILLALQQADRALTAGELHKAVCQGKPLAVPKPILFATLKALSQGGHVLRSGKPFAYRLPS
jgi:hypothetical protein